LRDDWFADSDTVGITAGTSTPDNVITGVEARLLRRCVPANPTNP
jgi:4-hydroxy-3-methylbut-2-enyl diphosphate reductase IspH